MGDFLIVNPGASFIFIDEFEAEELIACDTYLSPDGKRILTPSAGQPSHKFTSQKTWPPAHLSATGGQLYPGVPVLNLFKMKTAGD
jgi:hypothetical protein